MQVLVGILYVLLSNHPVDLRETSVLWINLSNSYASPRLRRDAHNVLAMIFVFCFIHELCVQSVNFSTFIVLKHLKFSEFIHELYPVLNVLTILRFLEHTYLVPKYWQFALCRQIWVDVTRSEHAIVLVFQSFLIVILLNNALSFLFVLFL